LLQHADDGWYIPRSDPERPVSVGQEAYQTRTSQPSATISALYQDLVIDVFWNGRIGPLPGFSSSPHMGSLRTRAVEIKDPVDNQTPLGLPKINELQEVSSSRISYLCKYTHMNPQKIDSFTFDKYVSIYLSPALQCSNSKLT
jgi:hypothetical protein